MSLDGQDLLICELHEIHPLGYTFYKYFGSKQLEVNGECLEPVWRHGITLPNVFFSRDHNEEIHFPNGRTLCCTKDPHWFKLVHDFIHSAEGVAFYADIFWLKYQHESNQPSVEAVKLHTELFELKGGSGNLNLSVEDLQ